MAVATIFIRVMTAEAQRNLDAFSGRWDASMARMSMNMRELEGLTTKWNRAFMGMGVAMGIGAAAVGGAFFGIYKVVAPFEASLRRLSFYLDDYNEEMNEVGETTWEVANVVKKTAEIFGYSTDLAMEGMVKLARMMELTNEEMKYFASILIPAAVAAEMDLEAVAMVLVKTMNAFHIETSRAGYVLDYMRAVADKAALEMDDFLDAIQHGGTVAHLAGMEFEMFTRIIATLDLAAIKTGKAGRGLTRVLIELIKEGDELESAWVEITEALGVSIPFLKDGAINIEELMIAARGNTYQMEQMALTFDNMGIRGGVVLATLLSGVDIYDELTESMSKTADIMGSNAKLAMIYSTSLEGMIATMKEVFFNAFKTEEVMAILHDTMYLLGETVKELTPVILTFVVALLEMSPELIHMLGEAMLLLAGKSGALLEVIRVLTHTLEAVALMFAMLPKSIISLLIYGGLLIHLIKPFMIAAFHAWEIRIAATTILNQALAFSIGHLMMAMSMLLASVFLVVMATDQWKRGNKILGDVLILISGILLILAARHIAVSVSCMIEAAAYKYLAYTTMSAATASLVATAATGIGIAVALAAIGVIIYLIWQMQQYRDELIGGTEATEEYTNRMKAYRDMMKEITEGMKGFTASGEQAAWTISGLSGLMARGSVNAEMYRDVMIILAEDCAGIVVQAFAELKTYVGKADEAVGDFQTTADGVDFSGIELSLMDVTLAAIATGIPVDALQQAINTLEVSAPDFSNPEAALADIENAADLAGIDVNTLIDALEVLGIVDPDISAILKDLEDMKTVIGNAEDAADDDRMATETLLDAIHDATQGLRDFLDAWNNLKLFSEGPGGLVVDALKEQFGNLYDELVKANKAWTDFTDKLSWDITKGVFSGVGDFFGGITDWYNEMFRGGGAAGGAEAKVYQHGYTAMSPQLAMIGEAGPEVVLPLTGISAGKPGLGATAGGLGTTKIDVNIDKVYISNDYDVKRLARQVGRELALDLRRKATISV